MEYRRFVVKPEAEERLDVLFNRGALSRFVVGLIAYERKDWKLAKELKRVLRELKVSEDDVRLIEECVRLSERGTAAFEGLLARLRLLPSARIAAKLEFRGVRGSSRLRLPRRIGIRYFW